MNYMTTEDQIAQLAKENELRYAAIVQLERRLTVLEERVKSLTVPKRGPGRPPKIQDTP